MNCGCGWIAGVRQCLLIQELMTSFMQIQFLASMRIGIVFMGSSLVNMWSLCWSEAVMLKLLCRCEMEDILLEMDRILRPEGSVIVRENVEILAKIKTIADKLNWSSEIVNHEDGSSHQNEKILFAVKNYWTAPPQISDQQGSTAT